RVHISHLKAVGPNSADEVLASIDRAKRDVDLSFDVYPYQPGSSMLSYLLPYEAWDDGPLGVLAKLRDPIIRQRFARGLEQHRLDLDHIRIAWVSSQENAVHHGRRLSDYAREVARPPEEALLNLLIEERLAVLLVFDEGDDRRVRPFLEHDLYMMGTDGIYADDGPIHPRMYGSAGRLLGPLVRDEKLFSLEDAVWKLSGRAAERFRLKDRGVLREGAFADLVVFDPATVTDRATYGEPRQATIGIEHVLVNGRPIIADGAPLESLPDPLPGRALASGE
ncbi:MAG: amidohydrolase family protein, partial [Planctomycetaceae bacterium]